MKQPKTNTLMQSDNWFWAVTPSQSSEVISFYTTKGYFVKGDKRKEVKKYISIIPEK